jgi:hypothetical protein
MLTCICTQCLALLSLANEPEAKSIPPSEPCCMCGLPDERFSTGQGRQVLTLDHDPRGAWDLGDYDNGEHGCPRCGRSRLCQCPNGKHRCEKCNWCPELGTYAPNLEA